MTHLDAINVLGFALGCGACCLAPFVVLASVAAAALLRGAPRGARGDRPEWRDQPDDDE